MQWLVNRKSKVQEHREIKKTRNKEEIRKTLFRMSRICAKEHHEHESSWDSSISLVLLEISSMKLYARVYECNEICFEFLYMQCCETYDENATFICFIYYSIMLGMMKNARAWLDREVKTNLTSQRQRNILMQTLMII